jgi:hypothetical protein
MFAALRQLLCQHNIVRVIRWHRECVPQAWKTRLLYVDRHHVHNFVQCVSCSKVLSVDQKERLYEQIEGK